MKNMVTPTASSKPNKMQMKAKSLVLKENKNIKIKGQ